MELSIFAMMVNAGLVVKLVMVTLCIFSLVSWTIVIMKELMFRKARNASLDFLDAFWDSKTLNEVYDRAADEGRPTHEIADAIAEARIRAAGHARCG